MLLFLAGYLSQPANMAVTYCGRRILQRAPTPQTELDGSHRTVPVQCLSDVRVEHRSLQWVFWKKPGKNLPPRSSRTPRSKKARMPKVFWRAWRLGGSLMASPAGIGRAECIGPLLDGVGSASTQTRRRQIPGRADTSRRHRSSCVAPAGAGAIEVAPA